MSGMHFERMAADYAGARPPYPKALYDVLRTEGVIGPATRVLEIGAGTGLATRELVHAGSDVVAVEPGRELAALLRKDVPQASVVLSSVEDADLPVAHFDAAVAATAMHWVNLEVTLPRLHAALRPGGRLAVWRHRFGVDGVDTPFRRRVQQIVAARMRDETAEPRRDDRPTMGELTSCGWFEAVRTERWPWSVHLSTDRIRALFRSFSDWSVTEVEAAARATDDLGGVVTEHYETVLHLLRRSEEHGPDADASSRRRLPGGAAFRQRRSARRDPLPRVIWHATGTTGNPNSL